MKPKTIEWNLALLAFFIALALAVPASAPPLHLPGL